MNAGADQIAQLPNGGCYPHGAKTALVWTATVTTSLVSHLTEIKTVLEIIAWSVTIAFTLWQWRRAARRGIR